MYPPYESAVDGHSFGVEIGLGGDPIQKAADVADAVLAHFGVIELEIGLAVAGRTRGRWARSPPAPAR